MPFSRAELPSIIPSSDSLTASMAGIGFNFGVAPASDPNIEDTLFFASAEAIDKDDLRVLAMLVTWFGVHHEWVNADRLTKLVARHGSERVRALWTALVIWQAKDRRFARLGRTYDGPRVDLLATGAQFRISLRGEDRRFAGTCLRVPAGVLRERDADVLSPAELARYHSAYRCRVMMGANYRADLWAALEAAPSLSSAELARRTYSSFATAWQAKRDFSLLSA
jgi:hypothetical protein